jgi:hypothetical protein
MTIIHKSLGNNPKVIQKAFRQHFADGLSGLRYDAYCYGWKDGWQEGKQVAEAKNKELREFVQYVADIDSSKVSDPDNENPLSMGELQWDAKKLLKENSNE